MFFVFKKFIFEPLVLILTYKIRIYEFSFCILDILFFSFWCVMLGLVIKVITNFGD